MAWKLRYGEQAENLEAMVASFQRIPEYLKNCVKPSERVILIWRIFWELNLGRQYFSTGKARRLNPTDIESRFAYYGFGSYQIEELKNIIYQMDLKYCDYDNEQYERIRQKYEKP